MVSRSAVVSRLLELFRFGSVGAVAFVVDMGLFNLLMFGPGQVLGHKPLTSKVISVVVATLVSWLGNRYWTFSARRQDTHGRELVAFVIVNVGGMLIAVACLGVSRYVLRLDSPLADNIAANGVGLVLGMAFRYVAYRTFVFTNVRDGAVSDVAVQEQAAPSSATPTH
ncbi:GtrA family protein [Sanguibacter hominis ATCC BAA-789]|uniref:GtrA family protein n=1 Tax=Sanguibacter hominis ATCC BAA-789 TaxID=1312740 RepID=A0A9X5FGI4_9MICO|nr:GtrA family protein [Sanguibacter hominis]NKX93706.1 GtrA family protein [Sanguibacter hominis ATCC BAA-789]